MFLRHHATRLMVSQPCQTGVSETAVPCVESTSCMTACVFVAERQSRLDLAQRETTCRTCERDGIPGGSEKNDGERISYVDRGLAGGQSRFPSRIRFVMIWGWCPSAVTC